MGGSGNPSRGSEAQRIWEGDEVRVKVVCAWRYTRKGSQSFRWATVGSVGSDNFGIAHSGGRIGNDAAESGSEVSQICRQTEGVAFALRAVGAIEGHWGTLNKRGADSNLAAAR